jgi:hypothetical protein
VFFAASAQAIEVPVIRNTVSDRNVEKRHDSFDAQTMSISGGIALVVTGKPSCAARCTVPCLANSRRQDVLWQHTPSRPPRRRSRAAPSERSHDTRCGSDSVGALRLFRR